MARDYVRMMYRKGGDQELHGFLVETMIVDGPDEEASARKQGWHRSPAEAYGKGSPVPETPDPEELKALTEERDMLAEEVMRLTADLAKERERTGAAVKFDHDGDGRPGGSKPRKER